MSDIRVQLGHAEHAGFTLYKEDRSTVGGGGMVLRLGKLYPNIAASLYLGNRNPCDLFCKLQGYEIVKVTMAGKRCIGSKYMGSKYRKKRDIHHDY